MKRTSKAHPQPTRAELKAQLLAQAEATIEQFLDWLEQTQHPLQEFVKQHPPSTQRGHPFVYLIKS